VTKSTEETGLCFDEIIITQKKDGQSLFFDKPKKLIADPFGIKKTIFQGEGILR